MRKQIEATYDEMASGLTNHLKDVQDALDRARALSKELQDRKVSRQQAWILLTTAKRLMQEASNFFGDVKVMAELSSLLGNEK